MVVLKKCFVNSDNTMFFQKKCYHCAIRLNEMQQPKNNERFRQILEIIEEVGKTRT